ncbi:hypothetical protein PoB_001742600 [Plakobranchus ocellatus]|uniref:Uncharacterized protein n=1 Tax=Plakobranchus ocellatus TaxID=259542 RepID=A0AAV3YV00_9GAST|nr:hypothetical protein PoB_001742600 [Plakobranchus ocellatus]
MSHAARRSTCHSAHSILSSTVPNKLSDSSNLSRAASSHHKVIRPMICNTCPIEQPTGSPVEKNERHFLKNDFYRESGGINDVI